MYFDNVIEKLEQQQNECGICGKDMNKTVGCCQDHNHTTGQMRSFLCRKCNLMLGWIEKNPELIEPCKDYLVYWNTNEII